jgi:hypothetical protein
MAERRGAKGVHDLGVRTRATDEAPKPSTPHALRVWMSTFELRWAEHLTNARNKRPQAG